MYMLQNLYSDNLYRDNGYIISKKKHCHNKFIYNLLCKDDERHVILNCPQGGE